MYGRMNDSVTTVHTCMHTVEPLNEGIPEMKTLVQARHFVGCCLTIKFNRQIAGYQRDVVDHTV